MSEMKNKPYSTTFKNISALKDYLRKEIGLTEWVLITQKRIDEFAATTEDFQWIHTDPEMSKKYSPYGTTVAHGFLVLSLASKFAYEAYQIEGIAMGVNYGLDRVRFPNATKVDSYIRGRLVLMDYKEIPNGARFKVNITFEIKGEEKPACVAEFIGQVYANPS